MANIDFTKWTTAQLKSATMFTTSPNYRNVVAELARREAAGTLDDGSEARIAEVIARNPGMRRGRRVRR